MDGLAPTVIYLASSLTIAPAPGLAVPAPTLTVAFTVARRYDDDRGRAAWADTTARLAIPVRAPLPVRASSFSAVYGPILDRRAASFGEPSGDEARRVARDPLEGEAEPATSASTDADLDAEVTAEHDARIGMITQRIEALRLQGEATSPLIARLHARLRLAVAARGLALARQAVARLSGDCPSAKPAPCPSAFALADAIGRRGLVDPQVGRLSPHRATLAWTTPANRHLAATKNSLTARPVETGVRHEVASRRDLAAWSGRSDHGLGHLSWSARDPAVAVRPAAAVRTPADALIGARRLLATARQLLEPQANHVSHETKLNGLVYWDGSESWSLKNYPRSAA